MNNARWIDEEVEYLDQLGQGDKGGFLAWDIVAERINKSFNNNRTSEACRVKFYRFYGALKMTKIISQYNVLLTAVESKYTGETRHDTALRYIKECERGEASGMERDREDN